MIVVNKFTGEEREFKDSAPSEIVASWQLIDSEMKMLEEAKRALRDKVIEHNLTSPIGPMQFKVIQVQRKNYDKSVMREVMDEDTVDLFLVPNKVELDKYVKALPKLDEQRVKLTHSMIDEGEPYTQVKLGAVKYE